MLFSFADWVFGLMLLVCGFAAGAYTMLFVGLLISSSFGLFWFVVWT